MKPKIALKNIKHIDSLSEETYCYSATIYVDGKRWGKCNNSGNGGPDNTHPFKGGWEEFKRIDELVKATYPKWASPVDASIELDTNLEMVCSELVTEWLYKKELKSQLRRKWVYERDGDIYEVPKSRVPDLDRLKQLAKWAAGVQFLNELPFGEALDRYRACIA